MCAALQCGFLALTPMWHRALEWFLVLPCVWSSSSGGKKKSQGSDSNPRPSSPQPSALTTRTRELDGSDVCIFIPWSARGASSSRELEERGGSRRRRERLRIRLSPTGGSRDWMGSHWSALLAVCWLLYLGLVALSVAPRGGYLQCRFLLGCGGLHALGWRGLHDAGFPTVVVASPPAWMGVPSLLVCRMGLRARPGALSSSRGPSPRNGLT